MTHLTHLTRLPMIAGTALRTNFVGPIEAGGA